MTNNLMKLKAAFVDGLGISENSDITTLEYGKHENWDSVAHMQLVASIETAFDIMLETQDVIAMSSFKVAVDLLKKYGVELNDA